MVVWDRAGIDFGFWEESKRLGVYFVSREKANMKIEVLGLTPGFDRADLIQSLELFVALSFSTTASSKCSKSFSLVDFTLP